MKSPEPPDGYEWVENCPFVMPTPCEIFLVVVILGALSGVALMFM